MALDISPTLRGERIRPVQKSATATHCYMAVWKAAGELIERRVGFRFHDGRKAFDVFFKSYPVDLAELRAIPVCDD